MAVASDQLPATGQQLTPPSSSHGGRGSWDFAVPLHQSKPSFSELKASMPADDPSWHPYTARQPLVPQSNGVYSTSPPHAQNAQGHYEGQPDYSPYEGSEVLGRTAVNGGAPDHTQDYYKADGKQGKRNAPQVTQKKDKKRKKAGDNRLDEVEQNDAYWIHRDKLKEIETRELEEAGFKVSRSSRSNSRSQSQNRHSNSRSRSVSRPRRDRKGSDATDALHNGDDRSNRRPVVSPIPAEDEDAVEGQRTNWDLRTSEEIAADREAVLAIRTNHIPRPGTSRIPVAKTSPAPVPNPLVERDAPLPRSRNGSVNRSGDALATIGARVRSASVSSQVLLDDPKFAADPLRPPVKLSPSNATSPVSGSPVKAKMPSKATPTSGARKVSNQRSTSKSKPRNSSTTSPVKRPGTSGGSISRPTTSHRPEGEAPWIATMYKPDPRLPPDQQIIPTHAKRLQQQQWEQEGKTGSVYDRDFRLLNTEDFKDKRASQAMSMDLDQNQSNEQWPLASPTRPTQDVKQTPERVDIPAKSPTTEQSSYKLTPTIPQERGPSRAQSRAASHTEGRLTPTTSVKRTETITRLPEPPADEKKEKKGCGCIMM
ncbi:hypothetical protein M011DRAFT_460591 [Sporormia fimetaria CBS 119925]|uniref:Uncharacterized protein n=1 Tax=Sporormia fimetaria CBS 119925 TaxID=1340428 RepID=A0A6A6V4Z5_9PLEO|nr:hypothetical protein M011DRAFT_460591 [Sporormia fimetaria CBS 119925]